MDLIDDDELNQKLQSINKKIDEDLNKSCQSVLQKIDEIKYKLSDNSISFIQEKKIFLRKFYEKKYNIIPKIQMIPENNDNHLNYFINVVLFILANIETLSQFCLEEKYKEILKKLGNNETHFITLFIDLIKNMYIAKNNNINITPIHNFLKSEINKDYISYECQNPSILINKILDYLEKDIKKTNEKNVITNNFSANLKTMKMCIKCQILTEINTEKKFIIDLYVKQTVKKDLPEEMVSIQKDLLKDEQLEKKKFPCPTCKQNMTVYRTIENSKNYLIFNIDRNKNVQNPIKIKYSTELKLTEEKDYDHVYELILALTDKNINILNQNANNNNINDQVNCVLFFKNFIKDKWYILVNGIYKDFHGNIKDELNKRTPNILIYKKKSIKYGKQ